MVSNIAKDLSLPRHLPEGLPAGKLRRGIRIAVILTSETPNIAQETTISLVATEKDDLAVSIHTIIGDPNHRSSRRHDDSGDIDNNSHGNRDNYSRDERGRNDDVNPYDYDYNHRNSWRNGDNNMFSNHQRNYPRNQNFYDYQSRDQNNGYIRHTTTRGREDNHLIEIRPMVATDLKEGRTEIAVEIITTILRTSEIIMVGDQIRTQISQARATSVERKITNLLDIVIEMMTTNLMTNREIPARSQKMTLGRRKTQFIRVFPMTLPVWNLSTRVLLAQIPLLKLLTHHSPTNRIVLEARLIQFNDAQAVKLLYEKLHVPDKTNWQIRVAKIESELNVKLPVGNIKDFRYVLMWMFKQVYKEFKEWTTSFHMILIGTAYSKFSTRRSQK